MERKLNTQLKPRKWAVNEDIVISGLAGRYPKSENVEQFKENLFSKVQMVTSDDRRFPVGELETPLFSGKIDGVQQFDNEFFNVKPEIANYMDPQLRLMLEVTHEAFVDAGIDPKEVRGSRTGYFYGSCFHEGTFAVGEDGTVPSYLQHFEALISYTYDLKGPIGQYDTACASSLCALNEAFTAMKSDLCDSALVAGFNICMPIAVTIEFRDLQMVSPEGISKCMDARADGYCRSEAVVAIYLQRVSQARRAYATILNCRSNTDGYKEQGINFPSMAKQRDLMEEVYSEAGIDPGSIEYIEAHVTGTQAGDPVELGAITEVFCKNRSTSSPLKIGCLKSNMGHAEGASGLCAVTKALIILQNKSIPPNLNFYKPNPNIKGLTDGLIEPVTETIPFTQDLIPLNCFGFGGANVHLILKRVERQVNTFATQEARLVPVCGRTEEAVNHALDYVQQRAKDLSKELLNLLHKVSKREKMPYRGYLLMQSKGEVLRSVAEVPKREVLFFALCGATNNVPAVTADFWQLKPVQKSFEKCNEFLSSTGLNIKHLIASNSCFKTEAETVLYNICLQMVIVDTLKALDLKPDEILSTSYGKIAAAYAKGVLSREEALAITYYACLKLDAPTNGSNIGTYGKTRESNLLHDLQTALQKTSGLSIAKIHEWISKEGNDFLNNDQATSKTFSLKELIKYIPKNSVVLEIGSKGTFENGTKATWRQHVMGQDDNNNPYTAQDFLICLGNLYLSGQNLKLENLYDKVQYPVPCSVPGLSSMIQWKHENDWKIYKYPDYFNPIKACVNFSFKCNLTSAEDWFFESHKIDGRVLFPATGYLMLAWYNLARYLACSVLDVKVRFRDVSFLRATLLSGTDTRFIVQILADLKEFVITEGDAVVCTGKIEAVPKDEETALESLTEEPSLKEEETQILQSEDIYKELRVRGYDYGPFFQNLIECDTDGRHGLVAWKDTSKELIKGDSLLDRLQLEQWKFLRNWVPFADSALQLALLANKEARILLVPTRIDEMVCDPEKLQAAIRQAETREVKEDKQDATKIPVLPVYYDKNLNVTISEGFRVKGLKATPTARKAQVACLEKYVYLPYEEMCSMEEREKQDLLAYKEACTKLAETITLLKKNGITKEDSELIAAKLLKSTSHFQSDPEFHTLHKALTEMIETKEYSKQLTLTPELSKDILIGNGFKYYNEPRFMRQMLEIAMIPALHQLQGQPINITEINNSTDLFCSNITNMVSDIVLGANALKYAVISDGQNNEVLPSSVTKTTWDGGLDTVPKEVNNQDFVVCMFNSLTTEVDTAFKYAESLLKANGFLLMLFQDSSLSPKESPLTVIKQEENLKQKTVSLETIKEAASAVNFTYICRKDLNRKVLPHTGVLYRKSGTVLSPEKDAVVHVDTDHYEWVETVKTLLAEESDGKVWLVSTDAEYGSGLMGMVKSLGIEKGGHRIRCAMNTPGSAIKIINEKFDLNAPEFKEILQKDLVFNVFDNDKVGCNVHLPLPSSMKDDHESKCPSKTAYVKALVDGDLSSLAWIDSEHEVRTISKNQPTSRVVDVYYAPLNFKDIMVASGRLSADAVAGGMKAAITGTSMLGFEFCGIDETGNRVMGLAPSKAIATKVVVPDQQFLWSVPKEWTLDEAATVPVAYSTVYYALIVRGKLLPGERILIHAGAGGVGLAAIRVALSMNCLVFTTVGSPEKRQFLRDQFPELPDDQIFHSRSLKFEEDIMKFTKGTGVDVILNSLAEEKLQAGVQCLRKGGRFLEIGKFDCLVNSKLQFNGLLSEQQCSFHGIMLDSLCTDDPINFSTRIQNERSAIYDLMCKGIKDGVVKPLPRTIFSADKVEEAFRYMAAGKHVGKVLIEVQKPESSTTPTTTVNAFNVVNIHPTKSYIIIGGFGGFGLEIADWLVRKGARTLVLNSRRGPVKGYHHLCLQRFKEAGVRVLISNDDTTSIEGAESIIREANSIAPVGGIFNSALVLQDSLFQDVTVDMFEKVCAAKIRSTKHLDKLSEKNCPQLDYFVVFSSIAAGRGNAGQTNYSFANTMAENICVARRRKSLHGLAIQWGFVGDVGYVVENVAGNDTVIRGTTAQRMHSCLSVLDRYLQSPLAVISSAVRAENKAKFTDKGDLLKVLGHILGVKDIEKMDPNLTMGELGMDSLMAVEIKQALDREYEISLTTKEIRDLKIKDVNNLVKNKKDKDGDLPGLNGGQSQPLVEIPTTQTTNLNQITDGKPLFVFAPLEGDTSQLKKVAEKLSRPVVNINWTYDFMDVNSIDEAVSTMASTVEEMDRETLIDVVGYSFGGLVALKLMEQLQLQKSPKQVRRLLLLDSNPDQLKAKANEVLEKHQAAETEGPATAELLAGSMARVGMHNFEEIKMELVKVQGLEAREARAVDLMKAAGVKEEAIDSVIKGSHMLMHKTKLVAEFKLDPEVKTSDILHLRASETQKLTQGEDIGSVVTFEGNHHTFIEQNLDGVVQKFNEYFA